MFEELADVAGVVEWRGSHDVEAAVARHDVDDLRRRAGDHAALVEVLVLGGDGKAVLGGLVPDVPVGFALHAELTDVQGSGELVCDS